MNKQLSQAIRKLSDNSNFNCVLHTEMCSVCSESSRDRQSIQILGATLLALSLLLIVGTAYLFYSVDRSDSKPDNPANTVLVLLSLYTAMAIGISAFVTGLWHLAIGRRNLSLIWIVFTLTVVVFGFSSLLPD